MHVSYDPEAYLEGLSAADWYEAKERGLGARFAAEWKRVEKDITARPDFYRCRYGPVRACNFQVFPYRLLYRIKPSGEVQILAVMHHAREPGYWQPRAGGA
jgi:hypothetical protein